MNKCYYCGVWGNTPHAEGCPQPALKKNLLAGQEAVAQYYAGYDDAEQEQSARTPSDHPSYQFGLTCRLVELEDGVDDGGGATKYPYNALRWENWEDRI